jgi:hypothetical protein
MCESRKRWEPNSIDFWPVGLTTGQLPDYSLSCFLKAYETVGFVSCGVNGSFEFGFQKVAIYSELDPFGDEWPQHTARQTFWGKAWLSKMGFAEDIRHDSTKALEGASYGRVIVYMKRSWFQAIFSPSSVWMRATLAHFFYRRLHPTGL